RRRRSEHLPAPGEADRLRPSTTRRANAYTPQCWPDAYNTAPWAGVDRPTPPAGDLAYDPSSTGSRGGGGRAVAGQGGEGHGSRRDDDQRDERDQHDDGAVAAGRREWRRDRPAAGLVAGRGAVPAGRAVAARRATSRRTARRAVAGRRGLARTRRV